MIRELKSAAGEGRSRVEALLTLTGRGAVLQLYGGESFHVGTAVLSVPRPSLAESGKTSATSSVMNLPSHKDEVIARAEAERLAAALGEPVVCVGGIHIDNAKPHELQALQNSAREAVDGLIRQI